MSRWIYLDEPEWYELPEGEGGVYRIDCTTNGMWYVGRSKNLNARKGQHFEALALGEHSNSRMQRDYDKYRPMAFEFTILKKFDTEQEQIEAEQSILDAAVGRNDCYNRIKSADNEF